MPNQDYKWKRFWCPQSGSINLGDGGYLVDPDFKWGHHYNSDLVDFETILKYPCLILLGELGIGKSHATSSEKQQTGSQTSSYSCCFLIRS
jgi:predicted NACHT family NTPase